MNTQKGTWPEFLQRLNALTFRVHKLSQKPSLACELFLVDLLEWRLRFSNQTPLIWMKAEITNDSEAFELSSILLDVAREHGWNHRECIVLLDIDGRELKAQVAGQYFPRFLIIDTADQQRIMAARSFTQALLDLIFEQRSIASLAPYQISAPVEGSSFFGRQAEISRILTKPETNFAVLGVRRIGKTSLLKEVRRLLLDQGENPERIVWLDCSTLSSPQHFEEEIVRRLNIRELYRLQKKRKLLFDFSDFLKRMSKMHHGRITFFLDEADQFLIWARDVLLPALRASVSAGYCRYIVSGFQTVMKEIDDSKSPFYVGLEPMRLGPFSKKETEQAVLHPMRSLRVRFENEEEVVARIHADTRGHPALIQYCCLELVNHLERHDSRTISPSNLDSIYASDDFKARIVNAFRDNVSLKDKVLVYALLNSYPVSKDAFTQEEMYGALRKQGCQYSSEEIDRICERLVLAGVLVHEIQKYMFAVPIFPRMLRANYNLDYLLSVAKREVNQ